MGKTFSDKDVCVAAKERIAYIFQEFENVLVAFSGGKDSSVCLNLCYEYAQEHNMLDKLAMYHLDYEAQYQMTTDYVEQTFKQFSDIRRFWLCLPMAAQCCCQMDSGTWIPWEREKQDIWVRPMPDYRYVVNEDNAKFKFEKGMFDYTVQTNFGKWFAKENGKTAVVVGIRAQESLQRYHAVSHDDKKSIYDGKKWATVISKECVNVYPLYDWKTEDIWVANARFGYEYNKLYDLYYQAGLGINDMRVASPFNDCASNTLKLYKVIDPNNWGKMVGRINGVNFVGLYGGTTAMGWRSIKKPDHFTWKEYCYFLLGTLDEKTRNHYLEKLNTSIRVWKEKGCCVSDLTIRELERDGIEFENLGRAKSYVDKDVIRISEYLDDTNCTRFTEVPTYKRMCICIMKNDYFCKYMGFGQTKEEWAKRRSAMTKYQNL